MSRFSRYFHHPFRRDLRQERRAARPPKREPRRATRAMSMHAAPLENPASANLLDGLGSLLDGFSKHIADQFNGHQPDPNADKRVGDIKGRPAVRVGIFPHDKVDYIAKANAVNKVTDRA